MNRKEKLREKYLGERALLQTQTQSKKQSLLECTLNISSGLIISMLLWYYIISPVFKIDSSFMDTVLITMIFTIVSIVRSYVWRRLFNNL